MKALKDKGTNMLHMEQKDYKLEIVNALSKKKYHVRELARLLNTNHMQIVRKIKELVAENVVDFIQEGKKKSYFLKKTSETRSYFIIAENYKLIKFLRRYPILRRIIDKLQKDPRFELCLIFGSFAKGLVKRSSDIDVFIETSKKEIKKDYSNFDSRLNIKIGKWDNNNLLIKEIKKNSILVKGGDVYYDRFFE